MATAKLFGQNGTEKGKHDLPKGLFDCEVNEPVIHQSVVRYLANQRQGSTATKGRSDVRGGGRKPFRQKGTGRARQGTNRSPLHRGGGVVFGPHVRDYTQAMPKKMRRLALRSSLSARARDEAVYVVEELEFSEPKTQQFADMLRGMDVYRDKTLVVLDKADQTVIKSARNIEGVRVRLANSLTSYDVMWAKKIIVTRSALAVMEEVYK